ncbi:MAG: Ppx/GppA phosphatase family protein [Planctomycetales bacterium]
MNTPEGQPVVAFMDIGTNSVRMLLARIQPDHSYTVLSQQKETVRLGEGEFESNRLQPAAIRRATLVCGKFAQMARVLGAEEIVAVATSATRKAANQGTFLRRLRREAQLDVRIISGKEEARLIYLGVASGINLGEKRGLFIDIGGGSTELIIGNQQQYEFLDSLKLGAIRLSNMFFTAENTGPVAPKDYARIKRHVRTTAIRALQHVKKLGFELAIGSSGTIVNLGEVVNRWLYKRPAPKDMTISVDDLKQVIRKLCALPLEDRRKVPGLNPDRADIIIGGAAILETMAEELEIKEIRISERGLREGLPIDYLSRSEHPVPFGLQSLRERSVFQLGRACHFDESHALKVTQMALSLFDDAKQVGLHDYGDWERELLEYAALLHDIGSFLSHTNHRAHSYYFLRNAELLGFDQTEIKIVATTALFHYSQAPRMKNPEYAELDKRSRRIVRVLSMLLRLAESLDRTHTSAIDQAHLRAVDDGSISLEILSNRDCDLELWGLKKHERAFEKTFRRPLTISTPQVSPPEKPAGNAMTVSAEK